MEQESEEKLNVCAECGYEGTEGPGEGTCPECGGEMISKEKPESIGEEGAGTEVAEEEKEEQW